jgi:hypothetical protein
VIAVQGATASSQQAIASLDEFFLGPVGAVIALAQERGYSPGHSRLDAEWFGHLGDNDGDAWERDRGWQNLAQM